MADSEEWRMAGVVTGASMCHGLINQHVQQNCVIGVVRHWNGVSGFMLVHGSGSRRFTKSVVMPELGDKQSVIRDLVNYSVFFVDPARAYPARLYLRGSGLPTPKKGSCLAAWD